MAIADNLCRISLGSIRLLVSTRDGFYLFLAWVWSWLSYPLKNKGDRLHSMQRNAKNLNKIPINVAFAITETISRDDLARLICWSFSSNIHHVTLYNFQGELDSLLPSLKEAINKFYHKLFGVSAVPVQYHTPSTSHHRSCDQRSCDHMNSCDHSFKTASGFTYIVHVVTLLHGHHQITMAAQEICQSVAKQHIKSHDVDRFLLDRILSDMYGEFFVRHLIKEDMPNPDFVIVFGGVNSLLGYPPWQLKTTEILMVPSHHKMDYASFYHCLERFANCSQRFGK